MVGLHGHGSPPCPSTVNYSRGPVTGSWAARRGYGWHRRSCTVAVRLDHGVWLGNHGFFWFCEALFSFGKIPNCTSCLDASSQKSLQSDTFLK
ncbi:hypothetical protein NL676_009374 [Syzygium grande]|nr:hypothetical protein NL676_009374 [Syzygium grande]